MNWYKYILKFAAPVMDEITGEDYVDFGHDLEQKPVVIWLIDIYGGFHAKKVQIGRYATHEDFFEDIKEFPEGMDWKRILASGRYMEDKNHIGTTTVFIDDSNMNELEKKYSEERVANILNDKFNNLYHFKWVAVPR